MSKMKAVVLEKSGSRCTVLGTDGSFRQVHSRLNAQVGEEIEIQIGREYFSGLRVWAGVAAMFCMILTALLGWNLYQAPTAVALFSVDINPSLQFTLDDQGHLLKLQTQNEDAKRMLSEIDLTGKPIDEVLGQIITQAVNQRFLNSEQHWVVVGYSPMTDKTLGQMPKELNETQIISWVTETVEEKGFTPQVEVFSLTPQERETAQKGDLSLGEYALLQTAQKAGVMTQPEKLKDTSERVQLLENPKIQAQIKAEKKELETGLKSTTPGPSKQDTGWKNKTNEESTRKLMPNRLPFSPIKVPSVGRDKGKEQGQEEAKSKQKDQENNQEKEHRQVQTKALDKTKYSPNKETERSKEQKNVHVPDLAPIPTPRDLRRDALHVYKIPERQDEGKMNNKSGRAEKNDDDDNKRG